MACRIKGRANRRGRLSVGSQRLNCVSASPPRTGRRSLAPIMPPHNRPLVSPAQPHGHLLVPAPHFPWAGIISRRRVSRRINPVEEGIKMFFYRGRAVACLLLQSPFVLDNKVTTTRFYHTFMAQLTYDTCPVGSPYA